MLEQLGEKFPEKLDTDFRRLDRSCTDSRYPLLARLPREANLLLAADHGKGNSYREANPSRHGCRPAHQIPDDSSNSGQPIC